MTLSIECQPTRDGDRLVFPYTVRNEGGAAVWIMDAVAADQPDPSALSFTALPDGDVAILAKLMPPLPPDRTLLFAVTPLARRLDPGAALSSRAEAALPLVEASAYLSELPVRQHGIVELTGIRLLIAAWPATLANLAALPLGDGLHRLAGPDLRATAHLAEARFPVRRLHMLRRTDAFARDAAPSPARPAG